jgi:hypothetical protein
MNCKICGKQIPEGNRLYCSNKCSRRNYYLINSEEIKKRNNLWTKRNQKKAKASNKKAVYKYRTEHKDRFNKSMLKSYYNNKDKWNARNITAKFIGRNPNIISRRCLTCGTIKELSLRYEEYPQNIEAVKQAIKNKKVYYLCKNCRKLN